MTRRFWTALALLTLAAAPGRLLADDLQAGAAKADITPPVGFPMWGYGARHDLPSKGVLDPLHARAVVLAAGKVRIAVVSLDLGRAPTDDAPRAAAEVLGGLPGGDGRAGREGDGRAVPVPARCGGRPLGERG